MRKLAFFLAVFLCGWTEFAFSAAGNAGKVPENTVVLLISEQNIEGPRSAWWASEIDLSATEAVIAGKLIENGYEVLEPSALTQVINKDKAFRMVDIGERQSIELAKLAKANFVIAGKAVASAGGHVPSSSMTSCFGNLSVKVIRVEDGKVIAYLDASGSSAHMDVITGGKEALVKAADSLSQKIIDSLSRVSGQEK